MSWVLRGWWPPTAAPLRVPDTCPIAPENASLGGSMGVLDSLAARASWILGSLWDGPPSHFGHRSEHIQGLCILRARGS